MIAAFAVLSLHAQQGTATLRGTVTDAKGAPMAGVTVSITQTDTSVEEVRALTGPAGTYVAPYLKPGVYQVTVEQSGYQTFVAEGIRLDAGDVRSIDPKLPAGQPVDAQPTHPDLPPIDTHTGAIRGVIDNQVRWSDAPVVDKIPSPFGLLVSIPGIQGNGAGLVISGLSSRNRQSWGADGIADDAVPGFYVNPNYFDTIEAVTANPDVQGYRATGFQMISRRGSNDFHGSAYYKYGSSRFDARQYFDTQKNHYSVREVGAEVGGPVFKDRLFFYGGWTRQTNPYQQTLFADVPTAKMRLYDFSEFLSPATAPGGKTVVIRDPRSGVPFPNNQIPSSRVNAVANNALNRYLPAPNSGDAGAFVSNYSWLHPFGPDVYRGNWPLVRADAHLTAGQDVSLRFLETALSQVTPGSIGEELDSTLGRRYKSWAITETAALTPTIVNHLTVGRITSNVRQGEEEGNVQPVQGDAALINLGIQGTNLRGYSYAGFPSISIAGLTGLAMAYGGGASTKDTARQDGIVSLEDGVAWSPGRHVIRLGVQYTRFHWLDGEFPQNNYGAFSFSGAYSGSGFADFLLGIPATSSRSLDPKLNVESRQQQAGAYLTDSFRITPRLTVDYGVRWDYFGSPKYDDGYMYNWDPSTGSVIVAPGTATSVSPLYPKAIKVVAGKVVPAARTTNFRPRVSAAYRLGGNFVLRGGYGEFTDGGAFGAGNRLNDPNGPFRIVETYYNSIVNGNPTYTFPKPFPSSLNASTTGAQTVTGFPLTTDEGVIRQYNVTLEHAVRNLAVRASYIGSRGTGLNYTLDTNKPRASATPFANSRLPYPQFGSTFETRTDGKWRYNSVQVEAQRRIGALTFDAGLTLADNTSNYANTFDPYNVTSQWTRDAAGRRRYFSAGAVWALPLGSGKRFLRGAGPIANRVVSDWTLQALTTFASGQYYTPLFTGPDPANASPGFVTAPADCIGDPDSGARTLSQWFNPAAITAPPAAAGRYGTCGVNSLEGYPTHVVHLSLAKRVLLTERFSGVFTVQVSNVTNTPHFGIPVNNISSPGAGTFTASSTIPTYSPERQGARQLDLKLRLQW